MADIINSFLLLTCLIVIIFVAYKVRRVHLKLYEMGRATEESLAAHYSQVEALLALTQELRLPLGLQPTRGWAGSPDFLLHVLRTALRIKPRVVVECSSGVSTVVLARAMQLLGAGHVWSLEHEPEFAQKTRDELVRQGLQEWATVLDAPLRQTTLREGAWTWYSTDGLAVDQIDMLVIDGPPMTLQRLARFPAVPVLGPRLSVGAVVLIDDASRPDETEMVKQWVATYGVRSGERLFAEKGIVSLSKVTAG